MRTADFIKETYGATVATILETDSSIVEVQERNDGVYGLIVHHRREDRDQWDDLTAYLKPEHFDMLGSVARRMRGEQIDQPPMRSADEIRAEIERITESLKETSPKSYGWRSEMIDRRATLTWVLSDPASIHADPPTTQEPRI